MSQIIEKILNDVCLDERIVDGIFRIEENNHMDALRDYFVKRGLTTEDAIDFSNKILEGKYPERQAYNKNGVLVTFPDPSYKARAIKNGTHFEKNPNPQKIKKDVSGTKEQNPTVVLKTEKPAPPKPLDNDDGNLTGGAQIPAGKVKQGQHLLAVEPSNDEKNPNVAQSNPKLPVIPQIPQTPERIAAEKSVVQQMLATNQSALTNLNPEINEQCRYQLNELYKKANELGFIEASSFLTPFLK